MSTKSSVSGLHSEMMELFNTIKGIKGIHYAAIVESAMNQANLVQGWLLLADDKMLNEQKQMVQMNENIISTNVALMISLWKTSSFEPKNKEEEEAKYLECETLAIDMLKDVKMLQAKQREYTSNDSH